MTVNNQKFNEISTGDLVILPKALKFAMKIHEGQKRQDGSPYITHPVAVLNLLKSVYDRNDVLSQTLALLHDTEEDSDIPIKDELIFLFGQRIYDGVHCLNKNRLERGKDESKDDFNLRYYKDLREAPEEERVVKLADRHHNLSELEFAKDGFRDWYLSDTKRLIEQLDETPGIEKLREFYRRILI